MFNVFVVNKDVESGKINVSVQLIDVSDFLDGDVLIDVEFLMVNYKDGLCIGPGGGLVCNYLYVSGIDFVGIVVESFDDCYKEGDCVVLIGWCVGEVYWGGYV